MDSVLRSAISKGANLEKLTKDEALSITQATKPYDILRVGEAALKNRTKRFDNRATYIENLFINPSNICKGKCKFCHYWAEEGEDNAYILQEDTILNQIKKFNPMEVHIVGGLNKIWTFNRYLNLIKEIRQSWPNMHIKSFTAVEIDYFATEEKTTPQKIIEQLKEAKIQGLTGGGAEIFSNRIRQEYCPNKLSPEGWLKIHKIAHELGLTTNATLLYGLGETHEEIIDHLFTLRDAQEDSKGFSCFIPLAYQKAKNSNSETRQTAFQNLMMITLARLVLHNFDHIKAYWPMIGLETAAAGLSWGADDLDGTLGEEKIAHAGQSKSPKSLTKFKMEETIRSGGFVPYLRDGQFNIITNKDNKL